MAFSDDSSAGAELTLLEAPRERLQLSLAETAEKRTRFRSSVSPATKAILVDLRTGALRNARSETRRLGAMTPIPEIQVFLDHPLSKGERVEFDWMPGCEHGPGRDRKSRPGEQSRGRG